MLQQFHNFFKINNIDVFESSFLVAVSGGIDSIALASLFHKLKLKFGIAHCNFQLRAAESDCDAAFVESFAKKLNIEFHYVKFETEKYAQQKSISIQMAARDLRYSWFEKIRQKFNYQYIAIGHNKNDLVETMLINLTRGTGISGMKGMKAINNKIVRPMLFIKRIDIQQYTEQNKLEFREDSSNLSDKYFRNKIRHKIIPLFEELNPAFVDVVGESSIYFGETEKYLHDKILLQKNEILEKNNSVYKISIQNLLQQKAPNILLFEILKDFNFSTQSLNNIGISNIINAQTGRKFISKTHLLLKNRNELLIYKISDQPRDEFFIEVINNELHFLQNNYNTLNIKGIICSARNYNIEKSNNIGQFDIDKLEFPLKIRRWQKGDYFYPMGMKGKKKISDFFIDNKFSNIDKEKCWILTSKNEIVWVIGKRIDKRFAITDETKNIVKLCITE